MTLFLLFGFKALFEEGERERERERGEREERDRGERVSECMYVCV